MACLPRPLYYRICDILLTEVSIQILVSNDLDVINIAFINTLKE